MTLPDGSTTTSVYDARGLIESLASGSRTMATFGNSRGRGVSKTLANGVGATMTYNGGGELVSLAWTLPGQTLPSFAFGYDSRGNRDRIRRIHAAGFSERIEYSADNQMTRWTQGVPDAAGAIPTPSSWISYGLDSRGNIQETNNLSGVRQVSSVTGANEIVSTTTEGYSPSILTWDQAGNLTARGNLYYSWNHRGLLDTVKVGTTLNGWYRYDPMGRRVVRTVGAVKTISVYDGWQCVWQKATGSGGDTTKAFLYGNYIDEPIAMIRKWGSTSDTLWYLQGNNYNIEALADRTGAIVERYQYLQPYGMARIYTGKGADNAWFTADDVATQRSARGNVIYFQGREYDAENGLYYFRNRYYMPSLWRFISRDPLRLEGDLVNTYRVEKNSPVNFLDPWGLKCTTIGESEIGSSLIREIRDLGRVGNIYVTLNSWGVDVVGRSGPPAYKGQDNRDATEGLFKICVEAIRGEYHQVVNEYEVSFEEKYECCEGCEDTKSCRTYSRIDTRKVNRLELREVPYPSYIGITTKFGSGPVSPCRNSASLPRGFF